MMEESHCNNCILIATMKDSKKTLKEQYIEALVSNKSLALYHVLFCFLMAILFTMSGIAWSQNGDYEAMRYQFHLETCHCMLEK